jgi:hypothetical protein
MIKLSNAFIVSDNETDLGVLQTLVANAYPTFSFTITANEDHEAESFPHKLMITLSDVENAPPMANFTDFLFARIAEVNSQSV